MRVQRLSVSLTHFESSFFEALRVKDPNCAFYLACFMVNRLMSSISQSLFYSGESGGEFALSAAFFASLLL